MASDSLSISLVASLLTTYLIHSTLLICSVWAVIRALRLASPALREQLWKGAALAGLLTTPMQFALNESNQQSAISNQARDERPEQRKEWHEPEPVVAWSPVRDTTPRAIAGPPAGAMDETLGATVGLPSSAIDTTSSNAFTAPPWSGASFDESLHGDEPITSPYDADLSGDARSYHNGAVPTYPLTPNPFLARGEGGDDFEWPASSPMEEFVLGPEPAIESHEPSLPSSILDPRSVSPVSQFSMLHLPPVVIDTLSNHLSRGAGLALLLCVMVGLVRFAGQSLRFHRRVRQCSVITTGPARESLDALLKQLRMNKTVTLVADTDGSMPAAFGLRNWRILLPLNIDEKLTPDELDALLAHELAHLVRGDAWWLLFGRLLCSLGIFQPLNFLARREWQRASEWQCDEWALEQQVKPLALACCLTHVAEWNLRPTHFAPAMGAANSPSQLGARVERLIERPTTRDPWKRGPRRWISLAAVLAAVVLVTCYAPRATFSAATLTRDDNTKPASGGRSFEKSPVDSGPPGAPAGLSDSGIDQPASSGATGGLPAGGATGGLPASASDPSVLKEQRALEQELQSLDEEIQSLDDTLRAAGTNEEMLDLLDRLRARLDTLRTRREFLRVLETQPFTPHDPQLPSEAK